MQCMFRTEINAANQFYCYKLLHMFFIAALFVNVRLILGGTVDLQQNACNPDLRLENKDELGTTQRSRMNEITCTNHCLDGFNSETICRTFCIRSTSFCG